MPTMTYGNNINLAYEESGEGFPILLFAPGGMRSSMDYWNNSPWNPIQALSPHFRVIAMDQRNAGQSRAPIHATDGWHSYSQDHLALLDHLGIEKCHLLGGCIGGPYCFGVIKEAPERVAGAVIQQTIGLDNNRQAFYEMFDSWASELTSSHKEIDDQALSSFRSHMYDGEFLLNVDQHFVSQCQTPLLVLMGNDLYHPESISRELTRLAPNATLIEHWKEPEVIENTIDSVISFLKSNQS